MTKTMTGSCHCKAVTFSVEVEHVPIVIQECNCSMCQKLGYLHLILPRDKFKLLSGDQSITTYTFNTGVAKHTFCKHCGVKSFYTPRSNPEGISVNVRRLDNYPSDDFIIEPFDGQNWEDNAGSLSHLA